MRVMRLGTVVELGLGGAAAGVVVLFPRPGEGFGGGGGEPKRPPGFGFGRGGGMIADHLGARAVVALEFLFGVSPRRGGFGWTPPRRSKGLVLSMSRPGPGAVGG